MSDAEGDRIRKRAVEHLQKTADALMDELADLDKVNLLDAGMSQELRELDSMLAEAGDLHKQAESQRNTANSFNAMNPEKHGIGDYRNKKPVTEPPQGWDELVKQTKRRQRTAAHSLTGTNPLPWIWAKDHVCPRCMFGVPTEEAKGEYEGARSRTDNQTEICSACGKEEGFEELAGRLTPQSKWPIFRRREATAARSEVTWEETRLSGGIPFMPPPTAKEMPDLRLHLLDRWQAGGPFERSMEARTGSLALAQQWGVNERFSLAASSLWWVSEDMRMITENAAETIPADVRGMDIEFPDRKTTGLVAFESPWIGHDADHEGMEISVNAISWHVGRVEGIPCISIVAYRYFDFAAGLSKWELDQVVTEGLLEGFPEAVTREFFDTQRLRGGAWSLLGRTDWPLEDGIESFDQFSNNPPSYTDMTDNRIQSMIEDRRFFAAFCVLVNHKLSNVEESHIPGHRRKQAKRGGHPLPDSVSKVSVVRLRQAKHKKDRDDTEPGTGRKLDHRIYVEGFWRNQPYGPKNSLRRPKYIGGYFKGPEGTPLVIKTKVRAWVQ